MRDAAIEAGRRKGKAEAAPAAEPPHQTSLKAAWIAVKAAQTELAQARAEARRADNQYVELQATIEAMLTAAAGEAVSDFWEAHPAVRRVLELRAEAEQLRRERDEAVKKQNGNAYAAVVLGEELNKARAALSEREQAAFMAGYHAHPDAEAPTFKWSFEHNPLAGDRADACFAAWQATQPPATPSGSDTP